MLIRALDGSAFCKGVRPFRSGPATAGEALNRLIVRFLVEGTPAEAVIDTGGAYLVLDPRWTADRIDLGALEHLGSTRISIRGSDYVGELYRASVRLEATDGVGMDVAVVCLIPSLLPGERWSYPNFLGWHGCLERLRIAVDPIAELFYFGEGE